MSISTIVLLSIIAVIVVGGSIWIAIEIHRRVKDKKIAKEEQKIEQKVEQKIEQAPVVVAPTEVKEQPKEEVIEVKEPAKVEAPEQPKAIELSNEPEPIVETDEDIEISDLSGLDIKRIPFSEKMLATDDENKSYYQAINDKFMSYRKVSARVSASCVSYRNGRDLIAKLTLRGKTIKLHLALKLNAVDEKIYFQKDEGDVKAYKEVPFTVKIKSQRGLKYALELIDLCAQKHNIEAKSRFIPYDVIEALENKADEAMLRAQVESNRQ